MHTSTTCLIKSSSFTFIFFGFPSWHASFDEFDDEEDPEVIFNVLVTYKDGKMGYVSLEDVVGNNKVVGAASGNTKESNIRKITMDDVLIDTARQIGICLGD